jgi:hypothetical protein
MPSLHAQAWPWLEIKPGYFFFADHTLRKIYHSGGFEIQGSATYPLHKMLAVYGSLGYMQVHGKSLHGHQKTSMFQIPFDVGLRAVADWGERASGYLSIGPRYFYVHQHNDSTYVNRNVRQSGLGFFVNGGCNVIAYDRFLLGIFGEYAFEQKSFTSTIPYVYGRKNVQIGGFTFGASIGYEFS